MPAREQASRAGFYNLAFLLTPVVALFMNATIKKTICLLCLSAIWMVATGCQNTAHGAGEDIEKMGQKIQEKTE